MYTGMMLLVALLFVVLNGLFVAAEFAFVKVRRTRLELLADEGNRRAKQALFGVVNLDAYLSVCQLGITLSSLGLGWIGEPAVSELLRPVLLLVGLGSPALITSLSIALGFACITFLHVVFGELVPKSISIQKAEETALILALPLRCFYVLWFPIISVMNAISNVFLRLGGLHSAAETEQPHSPEELQLLILDSRKEGQLDEGEGRMLSNIFTFYKKMAKDIMIHRMDTEALNIAIGEDAARSLASKSRHSRFPVYEGNYDNIIGFLHAKDLLQQKPEGGLRSLLREPLYAYETAHLDRLLEMMQSKRQQFCVVVDEYGAWQGIITMEDIVEAIVGDIQDEFDNEAPEYVPQPDGSTVISGDLSLDDLARHMDFVCPDKDINPYKIIAAHIIDTLGRIPAEGDSITLCGKRFSVALMDKNRIRRVRVTDEPEAGATHS